MEHLDGTEIMNYFYMNNAFSKIVFLNYNIVIS